MAGKPALTFGDRNDKKAPLAFGCDKTVLIEKRPAGLKDKSQVFAHPNGKQKHPINPIKQGDETVLCSKKPLGYKSVTDKCKHKMVHVQTTTVLVKGG